MKTRLLQSSIALLMLAMVFSACKKEKGESNDEEVITTVELTFVPIGGGAPLVFKYDDPDGPGGQPPSIEDIVLEANKSYGVTVRPLNNLANPPVDLTDEIIEEAEAHRFYYEFSAGTNVSVTNMWLDANDVPLGIACTWHTQDPATGTVTITLRHYPGNPPDKQVPDPVNSPKSSTDISVEFNLTIDN